MKALKPITPEPSGASPLALSELRLKKLVARNRKAALVRRKVTARRLAEAEDILRAIVNGGDMLTEVALDTEHPLGHRIRHDGVALMVTIRADDFHRLCRFGAELEDVEEECHDEGAAEFQDDEFSLGSSDAEPDQTNWSRGCKDADLEGPEADDEPNGDDEPDADDEPTLVSAAGHSASAIYEPDMPALGPSAGRAVLRCLSRRSSRRATR